MVPRSRQRHASARVEICLCRHRLAPLALLFAAKWGPGFRPPCGPGQHLTSTTPLTGDHNEPYSLAPLITRGDRQRTSFHALVPRDGSGLQPRHSALTALVIFTRPPVPILYKSHEYYYYYLLHYRKFNIIYASGNAVVCHALAKQAIHDSIRKILHPP